MKTLYIMYNGMLFNHKKKEILPFVTTWADLEDIMLSDISQTEEKQMLPEITCWCLNQTQTGKLT